MSNKYLTMGEASKALGLTKARISQLASAGALDVAMIDGRRQILAASVAHYGEKRHSSGRSSLASQGMQLTLMSADYEVARLSYEPDREFPFVVKEILDPARMPLGTATNGGQIKKREFNDWWDHRSIPNTRPMLLTKMAELGVGTVSEIPVRSYGLSLSDCYWLLPDKAAFTWGDLNYFENEFDGSESTEGAWLANVGLNSPDNTSEGELPKRWVVKGDERFLLKGSGIDDQRPYNECVATALYQRLLDKSDYVPYELELAGDATACACPNFLNGREEYIPAVYLKHSMGNVRGSSTYDRLCRYAARLGADEEATRTAICKMLVCDSLLANSDRHWRGLLARSPSVSWQW